MPSTLSRSRVIDDLVAVLDVAPDDLTDETNLLDAGLDSIRLMSLVEKWRQSGSETVDFAVLASDPVVGAWVEHLVGAA